MPFVFKFSGFLLFLSFSSGQLWLHDAAAPASKVSAREALASCPAVNGQGQLKTNYDVIRAHDAVWTLWLSGKAGLSSGCFG